MIITVTNTSGATINGLDVHDGGSGAVGGQRLTPLPHPFGHIPALADAGTSVLPVNSRDMQYKRVYWLTHDPADEWNALIQRGIVTWGIAVQADVTDTHELMKSTIA